MSGDKPGYRWRDHRALAHLPRDKADEPTTPKLSHNELRMVTTENAVKQVMRHQEGIAKALREISEALKELDHALGRHINGTN